MICKLNTLYASEYVNTVTEDLRANQLSEERFVLAHISQVTVCGCATPLGLGLR